MLPTHEGCCPLPCCIRAYLDRKADLIEHNVPSDEPHSPHVRPGTPLSDSEVRALAAYAWTGGTAATAMLTHRSASTIKSHLLNARVRLCAMTTTHAVWLGWHQIRPTYDALERGELGAVDLRAKSLGASFRPSATASPGGSAAAAAPPCAGSSTETASIE